LTSLAIDGLQACLPEQFGGVLYALYQCQCWLYFKQVPAVKTTECMGQGSAVQQRYAAQL